MWSSQTGIRKLLLLEDIVDVLGVVGDWLRGGCCWYWLIVSFNCGSESFATTSSSSGELGEVWKSLLDAEKDGESGGSSEGGTKGEDRGKGLLCQ